MKHKLVDRVDYVLIGLGVLLIPLFIGFIPLGIAVFRIGDKWQKDINQEEKENSINYIREEELQLLR